MRLRHVWASMRLLVSLATLSLLVATTPSARALTQAEIDAAARHAQSGLKNVTRKLTSKAD
jgi:hypothetical protein